MPFEGYYFKHIWSKWRFPFLLSAAIILPGGAVFAALDYAVHEALADDEYRRLRSRGWSPFWDRLPAPYNFDGEAVRQTGIAEPQYTGFVPPVHWRFQCPACGARVERRIDICWNCNYGAESKS